MSKIAVKLDLTCRFCKKTFKREKSFAIHLCEKRKRWEERKEKGVRLGYNTFLKFYKYTHVAGKEKTHEEFIHSPYYKAFVKFGRYCIDINAIGVNRFADYVICSNKKLDYWCSDALYTEHLEKLLKVENPTDALARAIKYGVKWGERNNANEFDMLRYGKTNEVCYAIDNGHISPWVVYNCDSGVAYLSGLTTEQTRIIWDKINPDIWQPKFAKYKEEKEFIQGMLKKAGW
jgi:hypothetical protein